MFELFEKYKANYDKLVKYGFLEKEGIYQISRKVMSGDFQMVINVEDSSVSFQLFVRQGMSIGRFTWNL